MRQKFNYEGRRGNRMASGTGVTRHNLQERIVQIRPALSVQTHLWPRRFNCPSRKKKKRKKFLCFFHACVCMCIHVIALQPPRSAASLLIWRVLRWFRAKVDAGDVWCKSEACVGLKLLSAIPQLKLILQSESRVHVSPQLCKLRSYGVTEGLKRPCSCASSLQRSVTM